MKVWYDGKIEPGAVWEEAIKKNLHAADIILLLVSADAIASDYFYEKEMTDALARHERGEAKVVPLIVRPCAWQATPLAHLQALPKNGRPVTDWPYPDHAYADAANSLLTMVAARDEQLRHERERLEAERRQRKDEAARQQQLEAQRRKDAAEAEHRRKTEAERRVQLEAERKKQAELERQRREAARQRRDEQMATFGQGVRSPCVWGSVLLLVTVFVFSKFMCNQTSSTPTDSQIVEEAATPTEDDSAPGEALPTGPKSGFEMVPVAGGTFTMGSPESEEGRQYNECQHSVTVRDFSIGKYEVTQADWREVMGSDPPELRFKGCDDCPVENVSWNDTQEFLEKASKKYGKRYRLPTEEEWEYAARGGNRSKNYTYSGSNNLGSVAWYSSNSGSKTHPVGTKSPNELGIYDMSGNVWEWCADKYGPYPNCSGSSSNYRVLRGGSWYGSPVACRTANRDGGLPALRTSSLGFRLVSVL